MAGQKGIGVVLSMHNGTSQVDIAGARATSLTINNTPVDVTSASSTGQARELLTASGVQSVQATLEGVYYDDAQAGVVRTRALSRTLEAFELDIPGSTANGTYSGNFVITSYSESGSHDGEVAFNMTIESGSQVTFA